MLIKAYETFILHLGVYFYDEFSPDIRKAYNWIHKYTDIKILKSMHKTMFKLIQNYVQSQM